LTSFKRFICERENLVFDSLIYLEPVERFKNRSKCRILYRPSLLNFVLLTLKFDIWPTTLFATWAACKRNSEQKHNNLNIKRMHTGTHMTTKYKMTNINYIL